MAKKLNSTFEKAQLILKAKNEAFDKMNPAQKRVAIAKDVLSALKTNRYYTTPGNYCSIDFKPNVKDKIIKRIESGNGKRKTELQTILADSVVDQCNVCAIGSVFLSKVSLGNSFTVNNSKLEDNGYFQSVEFTDGDELIKNMNGIFTTLELRTMEYIFEGRMYSLFFQKADASFHAAVKKFHNSYQTSTKRLMAIMKNIIKNKGSFKLPDENK